MNRLFAKKKVLIVDDEPNVRRLSRTILSKNFDVVEAEDGEQAIDIAKRSTTRCNSHGHDDCPGWMD